jgi:phosphoenolpyruvate synthase/pyruvate phosphate dikinase
VTATILWTDQADPATAAGLAGAKMGRLSELLRAGVSVPAGFSVTIEAYRRHCAESGLDGVIDTALAGLGDHPDQAQIEQASRAIRAEFVRRPMTAVLGRDIAGAYDDLCLRCVEVNVPTAVRSSAAGEDSDEASFAGIFDTYLGVSGPARVLDAVRACWGSLFTERALDYRHRRGISHLEMPIAVGVIELVHARASGVAFSIHPVTGKRDRIVIEASWGWGEAVVQGLVTPDHVEIGKSDGRILRYDVASKKVVSAFDYAAGRVVEIEMPARLVDRRVLDAEQAAAIADAVRSIEQHYGYAVDVEWVLDRHRRDGEPICIVQVRPVTAVTAAPAAPAAWNPVSAAAKYAFHRRS